MYRPILSADVPVTGNGDRLDVKRFVSPLASVLAEESMVTPLTVGVFGPWGSGKSSFLALLEAELNAVAPEAFLVVKFNPWIHRNEKNMLVPLLHALYDATKTRLTPAIESGKKILSVLARLGANFLLKTLTVNAVDLDRLEKLEKQYLKSQRVIESEMRQLHGTLETLAGEVHTQGKQIVFFIDDLDRCQPDEIIDVLESVKLFLNVPYVIVVLAVDKEVIDRGIEVRYNKFPFAENRRASLGAEYLEKMIQIPVTLPPPGRRHVKALLDSLKVDTLFPELAPLLPGLVPPNPRKIKRIVNLLVLTDAVVRQSEDLAGLDLGLLARLVVVQVQDAELYQEVARRPRLLAALEEYAAKPETPNFNEFGDSGPEFEQLCRRRCPPGSHLATLLKDRPFKDVPADRVADYLNLTGLGGDRCPRG